MGCNVLLVDITLLAFILSCATKPEHVLDTLRHLLLNLLMQKKPACIKTYNIVQSEYVLLATLLVCLSAHLVMISVDTIKKNNSKNSHSLKTPKMYNECHKIIYQKQMKSL